MCATHSQPACVEKAHWKGAVATSALLANSFAMLLATNRRTMSPTTNPPHASVGLCHCCQPSQANAVVGLAKVGEAHNWPKSVKELAKVGLAKVGLAKVGHDHRKFSGLLPPNLRQNPPSRQTPSHPTGPQNFDLFSPLPFVDRDPQMCTFGVLGPPLYPNFGPHPPGPPRSSGPEAALVETSRCQLA